MNLYWPTKGLKTSAGEICGWKTGDAMVVVAILPRDIEERSPITSFNSAHGLIRLGRSLIGDSIDHQEMAQTDSQASLTVWLEDGRPIATSCCADMQIILFDPPDNRRLRFFALSNRRPMQKTSIAASTLLGRQDEYWCYRRENPRGDLNEVMPLLNKVCRAQLQLSDYRQWPKGTEESEKSVINASTSSSLDKLSLSVLHRSATFAQLYLRFNQIVTSPERFRRTLHKPAVPLARRSQYYMKFWNTVWLILNDLILGHLARQFLLLAVPGGYRLPILFTQYAIQSPLDTLAWLDDWPIGLKLNTPLSAFFCAALGHVIALWSDMIVPVLQRFEVDLVMFLSFASLGGLTLCISLIRDLLSLATIHIQVCYIAMASICRWQFSSLGALWNLFRGKRWNILRQRTDSYAYDVDQLFLGTLLFTVSLFLFPTVAVYASFFYAIHLVVKFSDRTLAYAVMALNAFPLFEIMLRLKEPSRLPAGLSFELKNGLMMKSNLDVTAVPVNQVLYLKNVPKSFGEILWPAEQHS